LGLEVAILAIINETWWARNMTTKTLTRPKKPFLNDKKPREKRLFASPVEPIYDSSSHEIIGWIYEWNTGERGKTWLNGKSKQQQPIHAQNI